MCLHFSLNDKNYNKHKGYYRMSITNKNILKTRSHIKAKMLNNDKLVGYDSERKQVFDLLKRTIDAGESNSALLIGPRGVGKTKLMNSILEEVQSKKSFKSSAVLVRLNGLVHTDDRLALKSITSQMELDNAVDGKVFGSFAENLSFLLACLQSGQKQTAKSILFILEEFDLFCMHHNQTLLYNLFDVSQSNQTPICVFGITCRLDIMELFEKRVKSRFSHRQVFLFPEQNENSETSDIDERMNRIWDWLSITEHKSFSANHVGQWNKNIKTLIADKRFRNLMQRLLDIDRNERILKNIIMLVVSKLSDRKLQLHVDDFEEQMRAFEKDDLISCLQDLSVLELCLIIAMKHHIEIYDNQPFNFEMVLTRYGKFVGANSNVQGVHRAVVLKAFEHIQNVELLSPVSSTGGRLQKEYQLFKLLVTPQQITEAIKQLRGLPTEVVQWASSSFSG